MGRLRYAGRLLREVVGFAREHKAYWIVPLVITLALVALLVAGGQGASPFVYTLF